jgi:hypothetical protein
VGIPHQIIKVLAAASANNIAQSQSPGAGAILLNGSASNYLSTTTTAATAAGKTVLTLTSTSGVVAGQAVSDSTAAGVIVPGTVVLGTSSTTATLSKPIGGAGVGSGDTIVFAGTATLDTQRRVIITSGGNDTGINFTVNGTNSFGVPISDTFAGASGAAAQSNLDFMTVTSVTHTGSVAGTVTVGTNSVGSTHWMGLNWHAQPFNVELSGQVLSGSANWGWQYTYQDPNNLPAGVTYPQPFNHPTLNNQSGSLDGPMNDPAAAVRLIINSGTGTVLGTIVEAGISGQ